MLSVKYRVFGVDLETTTQQQRKVIATAFSDSFASWIMF